MLYTFLKLIGHFLFKIFFNMRFYGCKNVPRKGPVIIASNHLSYLDPIALGVASPRKLNFMAKEELFKNKLFAKLISNVGAFPLEKDALKDVSAIREAIRRLNQGKAVVIFPEGSRSSTGELQKGSAGLGLIAKKSNCPIVPAFITGTDKALPLNAKFIRFFRPISVYFGKIIMPPDAGSKETYQPFSDKVMNEIAKLG